MKLVSEIMAKPPIVVTEETTLAEVARTMLDHHIGCVLVINREGRLCGIITESDFAAKSKCVPFSTFAAPQLFNRWLSPQNLEQMYAEARSIPAKQIMTEPVKAVEDSASVHDVVAHMLHHDVNRVPVVRDGVPVGVVARHDLLKMMLDGAESE